MGLGGDGVAIRFTRDNRGLLALLGSEVGATAARVVATHYETLGRRRIDEAFLVRKDEVDKNGSFGILFLLSPLPPSSPSLH